jgi:hypothetical protein
MFWESRASVCTHAVVVAAPPSVRSGGLLTEGVYAAGVPGVDDFDRYVDERGIAEEHYPAAFALWLAEVTGGPVPPFEKVERELPADGVVIESDAL